MKNAVRLCIALGAFALPTLTSCADENDPKTWVKRLDDPATRSAAIQRLDRFFEDAMSNNGNNLESAPVKALLDTIILPLTTQYTKGSLDDKTRRELIKELSDMRDPRTAPALAKAFSDYEAGKGDDDIRYAANAPNGLSTAGKLTDQALIDAVWTGFTKFAPSKSKMSGAPGACSNCTRDLNDALKTIHHPSWGPKAAERIGAAHKVILSDDPQKDPFNDELDFWQLTSVQVLSELKFDDDKAIHALVGVVMTPNKLRLVPVVRTALLKVPKKAAPALASALAGGDPEFTTMRADFPSDNPINGWYARLVDCLSYLTTSAAEDAVLASLPGTDNDMNRAYGAQALIQFPTQPRAIDAFKTTYTKLPPIADKGGQDTGLERNQLLLLSGSFYESSMIPWLLSEAKAAKGDNILAAHVSALRSAVKVMMPDQKKAVEDGVKEFEAMKVSKDEKVAVTSIRTLFDAAASATDQCQKNVGCYLGIVEETIPAGKENASWRGVKAAAMAAMLGDEKTALDLTNKLAKALDPDVRLAISNAIDHLSPKGSVSLADKMDSETEPLIKTDSANKTKEGQRLLEADDGLVKVGLRIRARSNQ